MSFSESKTQKAARICRRGRVTRLKAWLWDRLAPKAFKETWLWDFFKPKVLSTTDDNLPKKLPAEWPVPGKTRSQVFEVDLMKLSKRWDKLNKMFRKSYWNVATSALDARNVMCAMKELPKGDTKLVVHRRAVPEDFPMLFLFSECYFVLQSVGHCLEEPDNPNLDSLLRWPESTTSKYDGLYERKGATQGISHSKAFNKHRLNEQAAELLKYVEPKEQLQTRQEESAFAFGEDVDLELGQYETTKPIQNQAKLESDVQYFLCCQGLTQSEIVDMVLTIARDVGKGDGNVALTCPRESRGFMQDLLGLRSAEKDPEKFFGRRLATSVEVHEAGYFIRFGMTKDTLRSLAAVINLFEETYGAGVEFPGMEDLFDVPYSPTKHSGESKFMLAMKSLENDFISRKQPGSSRTSKKHEEEDKWSAEKLNEALCEAGKVAGLTYSLKMPSFPKKKQKIRAKPPMVVFMEDKPYKVIWHSEGSAIIKKEHKLKFTGTGVKVRRTSISMWIAIIVGAAAVVGYFVYRATSSDVSFEDILQTALSIGALYAATVIPMMYQVFHNDEHWADVLSGRMHLDKRSEFDYLREEEKLHLCLRSLKEPSSDRKFIDRANACYVDGAEVGAAMHVKVNPCLGSLLLVGFKYWEVENTARRGLLTRNGVFLELEEVHSDPDRNSTVYYPKWTPPEHTTPNLLHVREVEKPENLRTDTSDCPIEHYYIGSQRITRMLSIAPQQGGNVYRQYGYFRY